MKPHSPPAFRCSSSGGQLVLSDGMLSAEDWALRAIAFCAAFDYIGRIPTAVRVPARSQELA